MRTWFEVELLHWQIREVIEKMVQAELAGRDREAATFAEVLRQLEVEDVVYCSA